MAMPDILSFLGHCIGALLAGFSLGALFFGGLWWTVRRAGASSVPARWFMGSLVVRTSLVLAGFYAIGAGQPGRMGFCLLGFLLARGVVLRVTRAIPAADLSRGPPCA
ncbi:MAG: ATP synthase subunit I [Burkholderiaceae bacterium]|nr:ATP synthase subunit I [Burkholderiaceae bacterium]